MPVATLEHMFETLSGAPSAPAAAPRYRDPMTVSAHDVAAVLRERLPGLPTKKLHKLLYYCQGHHLAAFDAPLFDETVSAWDMGPVVGALWKQEKEGEAAPERVDLDEGQLNTIGYVLSRYGALTGADLENLSHGEPPWRLADRDRRSRQSVRIEREWMRDYFRGEGAADAGDEEITLDSAEVSRWLRDAEERKRQPLRRDDLDEIRARLSRGA